MKYSNDLLMVDAIELGRRYRRRVVSPVEVVDQVWERLEAVEPSLHAMVLVDRAGAIESARSAERRYHRGEPLGALDGIPATIKDVILTAKWPTQRGTTKIPPALPVGRNSPVVQSLIASGAVIIGKTSTPEFGWKAVTDGPALAPTCNPWDTSLTSGGSSGGAAASVACGLGAIAVGTDGGGSVRIPAAFCGVVGLKPSRSRIPLWPRSAFGQLSHVGLLTRTVADLVPALALLTRPDDRDAGFDTSVYPPPVVQGEGDLWKELRVGVPSNLADSCGDEVRSVFDRAVNTLEREGLVMVPVDLPLDGLLEAFQTLWFVGLADIVQSLDKSVLAQLDSGMIAAAQQGSMQSGLGYHRAWARCQRFEQDMNRMFRRIDVLVTPTVPIGAFRTGSDVPEGSSMRAWPEWTPFTYPFNITGQPAVSVPMGFDREGRPVGLQFVGRFGFDRDVILLSGRYEAVREPLPEPRLLDFIRDGSDVVPRRVGDAGP